VTAAAAETTARVRGRILRRSPATRRGSTAPLRGLIPLVVLLAIWQLVGNQHSPFFPPPNRWWTALSNLQGSGNLWPAVGTTALTFLLGLAIATAIGTVIGILIGSIRFSERALNPVLDYMRNLPVAALVPVAAILLGTNTHMAVTIVAFSAVWPIILNSRTGVSGLSPVLVSALENMRLGKWRRRTVLVGAALPSILVGIRVAAPLALVVAILAEFVTNLSGLGSLLVNAQQNFASAEVYGLLVVAGILAFVVNVGVNLLEAPVLHRHGITGRR
jgi:ABC-type nitrate/sulfonate/bicarbonate transport system permease component